MASAPEVASVQDVVSVPDAASVSNGTPVPHDSCASKGTSVPNGTSIPPNSCVSNGTSVPNGDSVSDATSVPNGDSGLNGTSGPNGDSVSNGTSAPNGTSIPNGISVLNGTSATSPVPNGTPAISSVPDDPVSFPVADGNSTTSSTPASLRIAIIGGGIGGISLALGLLKHPHIDFQIYEAAPIWVQIGAGLGLGPNAQAALEMIGPETEHAFRKNVTGNLWESHQKTFLNFFAGQGPNAGQLIHTQKCSTGLQSCHRAHFVNDLIKPVPVDRVHMGKRLVSIVDNYRVDEPVILNFADGTTATADAVIGADGIHSYVREFLMGKEEAKPTFSGSVAYRGLVPMDLAIEKLGAEVAQNATMFCGPGRALLSSPIEQGKVVNIAAVNPENTKWEHEKWSLPAEWEELDRMFEGWGPQARGLVELLKGPELAKWAIFDNALAPTYTKGRVALLGDAAHATTPWQGQGAGQALEDALVLKHLLTDPSTSPNRSQLPNVFYAYDQIRRPRTQRVVKTSREAGMLFGMRTAGIEGDLKKMSEELGKRMHWVWNRDMKAQNRAAAELFLESL